MEVVERYLRELFSAKAILLILLVGSSIVLFAPGPIIGKLHFEVLNQKYGFIVGIVWLLSLISISLISLQWVKNRLLREIEFRRELKTAKDVTLTTEMKVILLFLYGRRPSPEFFHEKHSAIFRLKQINFIEPPISMILVSGSEFQLLKITEMGSNMIIKRWAEFEDVDKDLTLMEDILAQTARDKWTFNR